MKILAAAAQCIRYKISLDGIIFYVDAEFDFRGLISDITIRNQDFQKVDLGQEAKQRVQEFLDQNFYKFDVWDRI